MTSLRIILVTVATVAAVGCMSEEAPISSKVTLDGETWTATALSFDELSPADVHIVLAHEVDRDVCGWTSFDSVEMNLLIGDRSTPHVLAPLDIATPNSGRVVYTDQNQREVLAISGAVTPALTTWAFSEAEGHNIIVQIDGTFEVELADGRQLGGAFSATPCN
jgi:hypothetical protein